jgi:hypothetical protein
MSHFVRSVRTPLLVSMLSVVLASCGDSVTDPAGETEVISRVTLTLSPVGSSSFAPSAYIEDADGNGPNAPSAQVGTLSMPVGTTFNGTVRFENRLVNPIENITDEVRTEGNEHRVFYTVTGGGVTVNTTDLDSGGRPLGLTFTAVAPTGTTAGPRTVRVLLCHYDNVTKPATAASCTAETDIDVSFTVTVP